MSASATSQASRYATLGRRKWRSMWRPDIRDDTPEGAAARANLVRVADVEQRKSNEMTGAELGYRYIGSPLIWPEPGEGPADDFVDYVPTHLAGCAAAACLARRRHGDAGPHRLRQRLHAAAARWNRRPMWRRWRKRSPLMARRSASSTSPMRGPRAVYGYDLLLLRPDMHVAWRGNRLPDDPARLAAMVTGH